MLNTVLIILTTILPILAGLYSFWSSCKKDGFDQENAFDLLLFGLLGGGLLGLVVEMVVKWSVTVKPADINVFAVGFGFIGAVCLTALHWRWSLYRVLDSLAVALTLSVAFWLVGQNFVAQVNLFYLLASVVLFTCYVFFQKYRLVVLKSGFTFCLVGGAFCLAGIILSPKLVNLIFIGLLATLVVVVLIFRTRSLYGGIKKSDRTTITA